MPLPKNLSQVFEPEKSMDSTENDIDNDSDATVEGGVVVKMIKTKQIPMSVEVSFKTKKMN